MHLNTLKRFRHETYDCFLRAKDALFNMVDALITETQAQSFPELSLSPYFERRWASLYEAFEDGIIDTKRLQKVFATYLPKVEASQWQWVGIDGSGIPRPCSRTSADRTAIQVHNLPECDHAMTSGWQFSTMVALPEQPSSWTFILDQQRISSETTATQVAWTQLKQLVPQLPARTIVVLDRGYDAAWLWCQCSTLSTGGRKSDPSLLVGFDGPEGKEVV